MSFDNYVIKTGNKRVKFHFKTMSDC